MFNINKIINFTVINYMISIASLITTSLDGQSKVWSLSNGICLNLDKEVRLNKTKMNQLDKNNKLNQFYIDSDNSIQDSNFNEFLSGSETSDQYNSNKLDSDLFQGIQGKINASIQYKNMIIISSDEFNIKIIDKYSGKVLSILTGHSSTINILKMIDDHILISGSEDNMLKVWNLETRKCVSNLIGHKSRVTSIITTNENQIQSGDQNGNIMIWDPDFDQYHNKFEVSYYPSLILQGHKDKITKMAVDSSNHLQSTSNDLTLKKWSDKGKLIKTLDLNSKITTISLSKYDKLMFFGTELGEIYIQDILDFTEITKFQGHKADITSINFKINQYDELRLWKSKLYQNFKDLCHMINEDLDVKYGKNFDLFKNEIK